MIKDQFMQIIYECESQQQLNIATINQMLAELYAPSAPARVQLMTIHESKGLELDWVIMPGLGKSPKGQSIAHHSFAGVSRPISIVGTDEILFAVSGKRYLQLSQICRISAK